MLNEILVMMKLDEANIDSKALYKIHRHSTEPRLFSVGGCFRFWRRIYVQLYRKLTGVLINDAYRYMCWLLTVLLKLIKILLMILCDSGLVTLIAAYRYIRIFNS